jgi:hypothetical protein
MAAALRRFAPHGSFAEPPEWIFTPQPLLRNPQAFRPRSSRGPAD